MKHFLKRFPLEWLLLSVAALFPLFASSTSVFGSQLNDLFTYAILALGLNVVVGYAGLLHLGIAAFFGIGAYVTGILIAPVFPFQVAFPVALVLSAGGAALCGVLLGAPTLRLRGDYLALVTLGFGEVVKYAIQNLMSITEGTRGLTSLPPASVFGIKISPDDFRGYYYIALTLLAATVLLLKNLERSSLGRSWMAIREDELAATCMGINAARVKLAAFALGAGLAGMAGCLFAAKQTTTAGPLAYDFNRSVIMLCCIILGGLGSIRGVLLGVLLLIGFDTILTPKIDEWLQLANFNPEGSTYLSLSGWRLMVFGLALILMMRFRPEGLLPAGHIQAEMHRGKMPTAPSNNPSSTAESGLSASADKRTPPSEQRV